MINVIHNKDCYEISFPYDKDLVDIIRELPQRNYIPNSKVWVIPEKDLDIFLDAVKFTQFEKDVRIQESDIRQDKADLDVSVTIPNIDISSVRTYVMDGGVLYSHQKDFLKFALHRQIIKDNSSGFLLGDDPGLGKTIEGMNLALYNKRNNKIKHCLIIVCVNSAKYNWIEDIKKHTNGKFKPYLLGTRLKKSGQPKSEITNADKLFDIQNMCVYGDRTRRSPFFLVTNVESLRYKSGKTFVFADVVIHKILQGEIGMVIIDEIHKNMSPQSTQGKAMLRIKDKVNSNCMFLPMTGTPIVNRPTDVFLPLRLIDAVDCKSFSKWVQNFCVSSDFGMYDVVGYKNIPVLRSILQQNMLRRKKDEVLDLPPIIFNDRYIDLTPYQAKLYIQLEAEVRMMKDIIQDSVNPLVHFLKLRQVCGSPELVDDTISIYDASYDKKNAKLQELISLLLEISERHEKVVVFSNWVKPLLTLYRFVMKQFPENVCMYHGELSQSDRNLSKDQFLNDPNKTIMLGTIGALGVSHTLTCATNVIFYDEPWTYADKQQAWERVYRIGTSEKVNVYTLLSLNTIEIRVHDLVYNKKDISDFMIDNIDIRSNPDLLDILLNN